MIVSSQDWDEYDVTKKSDPLFLDIPDEIYINNPVEATVYINDEITQKQANYVIIETSNCYPYSIGSDEVVSTSSGMFTGAMRYNGQKTIRFGFRPIDRSGSISQMSVFFVQAEIIPGSEFPDTYSDDSEYHDYNCHREYNSLLCSDTVNGCIVCYKYVSGVRRSFVVGSSVAEATPPSRVDFTQDETHADAFAAWYSYAEEKETPYIGSEGTFTYTETYSIKLEVENFYLDLSEMTESFESSRGKEATSIGSLGGITGDNAIEILYYTPQREGYEYDYVSIQYYLYADMYPKNSGILIVEASRYVRLPAGQGDAELEQCVSEIKSAISSFMLTSNEQFEPSYPLIHKYSLYDRDEIVEEPEEPEELYVYGSVTDAFANPLPFCILRVMTDGKTFEGITEEDGTFEIPLVGIEPDANGLAATLAVGFVYERDGTNYFDLKYRYQGDNYKTPVAAKRFTIDKDENPEVRFNIDADSNDASWITNMNSAEDMKHMGVIYYHMHEAVDFYLRVLDLTLDYKLPVTVWVGNRNGKTLYSPDNSEILIAASDASISDSDRPKNREYHEFSHHVMYDIYGSWPEGDKLPGNKNHNGFLNPSTADSFMEGFAEFMALVISDELSQDNSHIYAGFGSMEKNYRPWDGMGKDEEFAVASLLWDLYDNDNEPGDSLYYSIETIWEILKIKRADFYEYYKAFKQAKPLDGDKIDELFALHGFFADTRQGNGKHDPGEPWEYTNKATGAYRFIDLSENVTTLSYKEGLVIGPARDYNRTNRSCAARLTDSFVYISDDAVDYYTISVSDASDGQEDYDYTVLRADNKIYLQPLPSNINANIHIEPYSTAYTANAPFETTNQQLLSLLSTADGAGFLDEHDFQLQNTGVSESYQYDSFDDAHPSHQYEGDLGEQITVILDDSADDLTSGHEKQDTPGFGFIILLLSIVLLVEIKRRK